MAFEELVRQTFVECAERGELLGRVRRGYDYYLSALVERVRFIEGTDRESRLRQVETELAQFKKRSTDAESKMTRLNVVSMLRTASAEVHGERKAEAKADKAKAKEEAKAGAFSDQAVKAFEQCTPGDQQSAFKQMIVQTNATGKMQLLRTMWKLFPEGKRPEIVRTLTSELPPEAQVRFSGDLASALTFEERVGIVQRLLREFSAFEMSSFVDFLPYIWDDLAVQFASKLLARMSAADRTRIASQLQKETDAAAVARALAQVDDSAQPAASAAQEEKVDLSCDPSQLLPDELPGWQSLRAASSSSASYDLARVHALSAECLEAALADLSPDGRLAPVRSATLNGATGAAAFPRLVLNVLLRHVTPPTPQQKSGAEHFTPMLQQAREALWTLLTSLRSHAKSSARAKLFARLCGVLKCEYDARRTDLALQLLASLAAKPGDVRELMHALANGDGLLPMQGLSEGAPCLPVALKQFETDLGGLQRVNVLAEKLMGIAVNDPRSKPQAALVIDCDTALLHVLDAYDSARQRLGAALTILHDQIEVQRASGTLDAHVFNAALCAFDASLTEGATAALYVDLDLAAHEEHAQASAGSEGATRGSETTPLRLFVAVCEAHGVTNVAKSVGTAAYT